MINDWLASDVLTRVTTPLALAALLLILGAGLLRTLLSKRTTVGGKMVIKYGFALAVILSLSANATYMANARFGGSDILTGSVRGPDGQYVGGAVVDVVGVSRGMTLDDGTFRVPIPRSARRDTHDLIVSRDGFALYEQPVVGRRLRPLRITLQARRFNFETDVRITSDVIIGHYVGLPEVHIPLRFHNPTATELVIEGLAVVLRDPDGREFDLRPIGTYTADGAPMTPPQMQIPLRAGDAFSTVFLFSRGTTTLFDLARRVNQVLFSDEAFSQAGPRLDRPVLYGSLVEELRQTAESNQIWRAGLWSAELRGIVNGEVGSQLIMMPLSPDQTAGMEQLYDYYQYGFGIQHGLHLNPVGAAIPGHYIRVP